MTDKTISWKEKHLKLDELAWMIFRTCSCYGGEKEEDFKNKDEVHDLMCEKCHDKYNKVKKIFDEIFGLV